MNRPWRRDRDDTQAYETTRARLAHARWEAQKDRDRRRSRDAGSTSNTTTNRRTSR